MRAIGVFTAAMLLGAAPGASAHHSFPAHYLEMTTTVEGVVTEYLFRNPHAFVHMEVTDENGETDEWAVELHNTVFLSQQGYDKDSLQPGDRITVTGNMARDGANRVRMLELVRADDGFTMEAGNIRDLNRDRQSRASDAQR